MDNTKGGRRPRTIDDTNPVSPHCRSSWRPAAVDHRDAYPATVRRGIAYMRLHLRDDIDAEDIAGAAYVTVRGLQLAFRRHVYVTPSAYLRTLRLNAAHQQLQRLSPSAGHTVATVAADWGFGHSGRFATLYRRLYGRYPSATLRS